MPGTTSAENVLNFYRGRIQLKEFPRFSDCVQALNNSEVDAVTTDDVILAGFAAQPQYQGKLKVVGKGFSDENYGVGIKKGNTALVDQVNAALKQYVADGSWAAALRITVAPSGYRLPGPPTPGRRLTLAVTPPPTELRSGAVSRPGHARPGAAHSSTAT